MKAGKTMKKAKRDRCFAALSSKNPIIRLPIPIKIRAKNGTDRVSASIMNENSKSERGLTITQDRHFDKWLICLIAKKTEN